jgi:O-antigen/teichoic acid export membrane protein
VGGRGPQSGVASLVAAKAIDFVFYAILARQLGVELFGRYTFAFSITLLFGVVADLGLTTVIARRASGALGRARAFLSHGLKLKLGLGLITFAVSTGVVFASGAPWEVILLVALFSVSMLIHSIALLFGSLLHSAWRRGPAGLSLLVQSVSALVIGCVLIFSGHGLVGGACAYLVAAVAHLAATMFWSRDLWTQAPGDAEAPPVSALLLESAPFAVSGVFIAVYFRIDSIVLQLFRGDEAVGLYGGVCRMLEAIVLIMAAYRLALFPVMARAADGPSEALRVLSRKSLRLQLMFAVGVATFITLQAEQIVTVVLGPAYRAAGPALAILIWALPGAFMADTLVHLLVAQRRRSLTGRTLAITAAFNLTANLVLVPRFSLYGAAAITVLSELLSFRLMFFAFSRAVSGINLFAVARAPLVAGGIAAGALMLLAPLSPGGPAGLMMMALFALTAYVLALVALGAFAREDAELVREILPTALRPRPNPDRRGT